MKFITRYLIALAAGTVPLLSGAQTYSGKPALMRMQKIIKDAGITIQ